MVDLRGGSKCGDGDRFWLGQPRTNVGRYADDLSHSIGFERFRARQFGIQHYCTVGLNTKGVNDEALAERVMKILPGLCKEDVVAIGEIGYGDQTALDDKYLRLQIELAKEFERPIISTRHFATRNAALCGPWTCWRNTGSTQHAA